ncbi:unnamed protein product [Larinioides sclopetarius]|uniref:Uncharacterized protein n=2 Tax=Larinioides sclopetarius TaxID=280406 RepID=A0AAV1ZUM6_9ARAC
MTIVSGCCCWRTLRKGSFASAFYTLILYSNILIGSSIYLSSPFDTKHLFTFNWTMLACYSCCVITSVLLLIGLCVDSHNLLIPWLVTIASTTILDILLSMSLLTEKVDALLITLYLVDFVIWGLNICSFLCVSSQYQEYKSRRNFHLDELNRMTLSSMNPEQECCGPYVAPNNELYRVPTDSTSLKYATLSSTNPEQECCGPCVPPNNELYKVPTESTSLKYAKLSIEEL